MLFAVLLLLCKVRQCKHPEVRVLSSVNNKRTLHNSLLNKQSACFQYVTCVYSPVFCFKALTLQQSDTRREWSRRRAFRSNIYRPPISQSQKVLMQSETDTAAATQHQHSVSVDIAAYDVVDRAVNDARYSDPSNLPPPHQKFVHQIPSIFCRGYHRDDPPKR